jgi:hypothetical protein
MEWLQCIFKGKLSLFFNKEVEKGSGKKFTKWCLNLTNIEGKNSIKFLY